MTKKKVTIPQLQEMRSNGKKFKMITCYDYPMAHAVDNSPTELILVGDSLGNVIQGHDGTIPVNIEDVLYHVKTVRRGAPNTFIVGDMPFLSYQASSESAIINAGLLLKAGADCVKMEGGTKTVIDRIAAVVDAGIPVIGHIGLTPQSVGMMGGLKVQGKSVEAAKKLIQQALDVQEAGAFAIVIECLPAALGKLITEKLSIPTISCGSGAFATGQNLNAYDLLGIFDKFVPKFVKQYDQLRQRMIEVFDTWCKEVDEGVYPEEKHTFKIDEEVLKELQ